MKKLFATSIIIASLLTACNNGKQKPPIIKSQSNKVLAVYRVADTSQQNAIGFMRRIITTVDGVPVDTLWGWPLTIPILDSLGKPKLDSATGKQFGKIEYVQILKDSVEWRIEGKDVDTLLKYFKPRG
jgi:hypothetical protein